MKKTMRFLSMAALALVGAVMTGCTNDDNIIDEPQQPASKNNVVTLTTTVSLDGGAQTRALTAGGVKTFAAGETMALVYKNTSNATVKVVSTALTAPDIASGSKTATFTFELTDPNRSEKVTYIYPAAMAKADGTVNYDALATQNGTLATLSSSLDLATYSAAWNAGSLPAATLENQLAILALTLKNSTGSSDITSSITGVTLSDGTNSYAVTRTATDGPIYVAIRPTTSADITVTATDGTNNYTKSLTGKTYAAGNGYSLSWRMTTPAAAKALSEATAEDVGKVAGQDGYIYDNVDAATAAGTTASAIIAYVGTAGSVDESSSTYKGLAIALTEANSVISCQWCTALGGTCVSQTQAIATAITYKNGIASTNTLTSDGHTHEAATAASSYSAARPSGTSAWFLPSMGQWNLIVQGLATKKAGSTVSTNLTKETNDTYKATNLNTVITAAGGTGLRSSYYWSSTAYNTGYAWYLSFIDGYARDRDKTNNNYVRSVLAF